MLESLRARSAWAIGRIAELVNRGRAQGWIPGAPFELPDLQGLLATVDPDSPMAALGQRLGLTSSERDVLWLLACIELDPHVARAALELVTPGAVELSAQLVEHLATRGMPTSVDVFARLSQLALIDIASPELPASRRAVRLSRRVLDLVRGSLELDRALTGVATLESAIDARRAITDVAGGADSPLAPSIGADSLAIVTGPRGAGRMSLLRRAISSEGRSAIVIDCAELGSNDATDRVLRVIERECLLHDAWPIFRDVDRADGFADTLVRTSRRWPHPVFLTARHPMTVDTPRRVIHATVRTPDVEIRAQIWRAAAPQLSHELARDSATRFALLPGDIVACARALSAVSPDASDVRAAVRCRFERQLSGLATRIETTQTWSDLVLPPDQFETLVELVARVRHRDLVLDRWGFAAKVGRGTGVAALLSGPPGTGKTMVAGLIASELGLDLYQVDLSRVVSKYIGETEKQLEALFEAADTGQAILLFDEADALFGKRTEVKASNDRYANLEVNYLLQRIERFTGIALLTTNHETAIDPAFMRRLAFHVRIPMPEEAERAQLWHAMIPEQAACDDGISFETLASEFIMSGGYIRNAVMRAAFLSANDDCAISEQHLRRAARAEYEAMGKVTTRAVR